MSHDLPLLGPIYDLGDGTRLQDLDGGCPTCGKRLAEVVFDPGMTWNRGAVVCIDCGVEVRTAPYEIKPSTRVPGRRVAVCQLCPYISMPAEGLKALEFAQQHYEASHG